MQGHMQLPDIFSAFSQPPTTQAPPRVSSLQALYAHLASAEPPQATASRLSQPTYPHLDNPQLPGTYFDNGSAQASSLGEPEFSSALASLSGAAHARQHLQLPHLEQSTQAQELLHHLEAQETLDWQRDFPNRPESVARPLLSPLANPVEYDDGQRLGSAQHVSSCLPTQGRSTVFLIGPLSSSHAHSLRASKHDYSVTALRHEMHSLLTCSCISDCRTTACC